MTSSTCQVRSGTAATRVAARYWCTQEQGFGDTIQFARYPAAIAQRGASPVLACEPSLVPLLKTIAGVEVVSKFDPLPPYFRLDRPNVTAACVQHDAGHDPLPCRLSKLPTRR